MDDQQRNVIDGTARARQWRRSRSKARTGEQEGEPRSNAPKSIASSLLVPADMVHKAVPSTHNDATSSDRAPEAAGELAGERRAPDDSTILGVEHRNPFLDSEDAAAGGDRRGCTKVRARCGVHAVDASAWRGRRSLASRASPARPARRDAAPASARDASGQACGHCAPRARPGRGGRGGFHTSDERLRAGSIDRCGGKRRFARAPHIRVAVLGRKPARGGAYDSTSTQGSTAPSSSAAGDRQAPGSKESGWVIASPRALHPALQLTQHGFRVEQHRIRVEQHGIRVEQHRIRFEQHRIRFEQHPRLQDVGLYRWHRGATRSPNFSKQ